MWEPRTDKAGRYLPHTKITKPRSKLVPGKVRYRGTIVLWDLDLHGQPRLTARSQECQHWHTRPELADRCSEAMAAERNKAEFPELVCPECGTRVMLDDGVTLVSGDGYDGLCPECADKAERAHRWG